MNSQLGFAVFAAAWLCVWAIGKVLLAFHARRSLGRSVFDLLSSNLWMLDSRWRIRGAALLVWVVAGPLIAATLAVMLHRRAKP
jgi:hypothetical protein